MHLTIVKSFIIGIILLFGLNACDRQPHVQPQKPASVPPAAFRVGGLDGGVYVLVSYAMYRGKPVYKGVIYSENGDRWFYGNMQLLPEDARFIDYKNPDSYLGWDGENLLLTKGRRLKALLK